MAAVGFFTSTGISTRVTVSASAGAGSSSPSDVIGFLNQRRLDEYRADSVAALQRSIANQIDQPRNAAGCLEDRVDGVSEN